MIRGVKTTKGVIKDTKSNDYFNVVGTDTIQHQSTFDIVEEDIKV